MKTTSFFLSSFVQFLAVTLKWPAVNICTVLLPPMRLCEQSSPVQPGSQLHTKLSQAPWPEHPLKQILPSSSAFVACMMSSAATRRMAAKEASAKTAAGVVLRETTGAGLERGIVSEPTAAPKGRAAAAYGSKAGLL